MKLHKTKMGVCYDFQGDMLITKNEMAFSSERGIKIHTTIKNLTVVGNYLNAKTLWQKINWYYKTIKMIKKFYK